MKKIMITKAIIAIFFVTFNTAANEQKEAKNFEVEPFTAISVSDIFTVFLKQSDDYSLKIEIDKSQLDNISVLHEEGTLKLSCNERLFRRGERIKAHISAPLIEKIIAGGTASVSSENTLVTPEMFVGASGASNLNISVETDDLTSNVSGASNLTLNGNAANHKASVSGASTLKAYGLNTETTNAKASGTSMLQVNATKELIANASGTSYISVKEMPENKSFTTSGMGSISLDDDEILSGSKIDTVRISNGKDTLKVSVGKRDLLIISDDDGKNEVRTERRSRSFRNNWSGIELGINGFLTPDHSLELDDKDSFLDIDYARSISLNLNFYQQNVNLIGNNLGLVTGIGVTFNNFAFDNNITLTQTNDSIGYEENDHGFRRNRLSLVYVNVPLLLEFQTSSRRTIEQFHFATGVIGGANIRTYSRQVYDLQGDRHREKIHKSYYTRPFKLDATVRIGWGKLHLFGTYSINTLFRTGKAPEIHPFNVGIRLNT